MPGIQDQHVGDLVLLGRRGRSWVCLCACGRIECYRWEALDPDGPRAIQRCTTCDPQECRTCKLAIPRGKMKYCSVACNKRALGLRQAQYYTRRMLNPEEREKRRQQVRRRRENMTSDQRERRRAQNRAALARLSPEGRAALHECQRAWYTRNYDEIRKKRQAARLKLTSEQRLELAAYLQRWYRERIEDLKQDPASYQAYLREKQIAARRRRTWEASNEMLSELVCISEMPDE